MKSDPSKEYVEYICDLYGDVYDDREEDSAPGGLDWIPGQKAAHKSLGEFKKELEAQGIKLSNSKLTKILITGGCWSTERSREIGYLYEDYTDSVEDGGQGMSRNAAVERIASELGISKAMVSMSLPYYRPVYDLEDKSSNARRIERSRAKKAMAEQDEAVMIEKMARDKILAAFEKEDSLGEAIAEMLKTEREKSGLSIEQAAEVAGIRPYKLSRWEENGASAGIYSMVKLLSVYYLACERNTEAYADREV